ncbi:glycosyltransferase family 25 protein [Xylariales sp. AK1849]|nr:glycosyltransferase family 25 protein [Xylariales sp. AK1849]
MGPFNHLHGTYAAYVGLSLLVSFVTLIYASGKWHTTYAYGVPDPWSATAEKQRKSDVFNQTLGFDKVFVLSLPERSDKRDALSLMSALTGFSLSWIDAVRGSDVVDKALPFGWDREHLRDSNLGSWRAHVNAMRKIVEDRLGSALIMEDDMDWDVNVKKQLSHLSTAAKELQIGWENAGPGPLGNSPYGQHWDMLWLGICSTTFDEHLPERLQIPVEQRDERKVLIHDDPTVPPEDHIMGNASFSWRNYPPQTRIVYVPGDNICSYAYALSYSGAQKALEYLGIEGQHKPFDNHLSDLCRLRANGMRCVSITPSLFVHHKPKGNTMRDSDIEGATNGDIREVGFTNNILYSTRLNLRNLITVAEPEKQWTA